MQTYAWMHQVKAMPELLSATEARRHLNGPRSKIQLPCWVLNFTYGPGGLFRGGSKARPWQKRAAGEAHLYPPEFPFWEDCRPVGGWVHSSYMIFLGGEHAGLGALTGNPRGFARLMDAKGTLGNKLRELVLIGHHRGEAGFWQAHGVFFEILDLLLKSKPLGEENYKLTEAGWAPAQPPIVADVRKFLEAHLAEPVTMEEIARHLNVSVSTLSHQYKAACGEAPMATRMSLVLNVAKSLLLKGNKLKQIAEVTGFCDIYHLSKAFKRAEGISPRAYLLRQSGKAPFSEDQVASRSIPDKDYPYINQSSS